MTPAEAVTKAVRAWVEERRTGTLLFNFRHGTLKHIEHQVVEFPDPVKSLQAGSTVGPRCPVCTNALTPQDGGAMWTCRSCNVKRTQAQLSQEA